MKKELLIALGLVVLSTASFADTAPKKQVASENQNEKKDNFVHSFEEALISAFNNNQEWFANKTEKEMAKIRARQSKMNFLPSLTGSISTNRQKSIDSLSIDNHSRDNIDHQHNYNTAHQFSLNMKMNIFAGLQTLNAMKMRTNEDKSAFHSLKAKGAKLIVDVLDAYSDVWKFRQILSARKKMEENLEKIWKSQQTKLDSGMSTPAEVAYAKANYQTAVYHRISSETELLSAEAKFEKITGAKLANNIHLPNLRINIPKTMDQLISKSLTGNHNILESRYTEKASLDALNVARGKLSPSIDAGLQVGRNLSYNGNFKEYHQKANQYENKYIGSLEMTIPLFANSGSDYSEIFLAEEKAKQAHFKANDTVLAVREQCIVNWNTFKSTDAMILASRASIESAQLSSESYQEESELGIKSNTEVWDQENKLQESKINFADSKKKKLVAAVNISFLMGTLELENFVKRPTKASNKKIQGSKQKVKVSRRA